MNTNFTNMSESCAALGWQHKIHASKLCGSETGGLLPMTTASALALILVTARAATCEFTE
jgi:hypothetical protein